MTYTVLVAIAVVIIVAVDLAGLRLVTRKAFWTAYAIVLGFQLIVNGLLTGLPVVRYRADAIIGWRVAYAPVEDLLFGFALALLTLTCWVGLGRRARTAHELASPRAATQPRRGVPTDSRPEKTS
jgi:lycopene cyclase domain-containing protein